MFEDMLASEAGRQLLIQQMAADGTMTQEQAACFLETADIGALMTATMSGSEPDPQMLADLTSSLEGCGLTMDQVASLGMDLGS